jgi:hypothetical protein
MDRLQVRLPLKRLETIRNRAHDRRQARPNLFLALPGSFGRFLGSANQVDQNSGRLEADSLDQLLLSELREVTELVLEGLLELLERLHVDVVKALLGAQR